MHWGEWRHQTPEEKATEAKASAEEARSQQAEARSQQAEARPQQASRTIAAKQASHTIAPPRHAVTSSSQQQFAHAHAHANVLSSCTRSADVAVVDAYRNGYGDRPEDRPEGKEGGPEGGQEGGDMQQSFNAFDLLAFLLLATLHALLTVHDAGVHSSRRAIARTRTIA
jgi:hypothetical protein